jgi:hypothetical protein
MTPGTRKKFPVQPEDCASRVFMMGYVENTYLEESPQNPPSIKEDSDQNRLLTSVTLAVHFLSISKHLFLPMYLLVNTLA